MSDHFFHDLIEGVVIWEDGTEPEIRDARAPAGEVIEATHDLPPSGEMEHVSGPDGDPAPDLFEQRVGEVELPEVEAVAFHGDPEAGEDPFGGDDATVDGGYAPADDHSAIAADDSSGTYDSSVDGGAA